MQYQLGLGMVSRSMNTDTARTQINRPFGIKKALLSAVDNRAKTMGGTGLEPVTSCVSSRRSSRLS